MSDTTHSPLDAIEPLGSAGATPSPVQNYMSLQELSADAAQNVMAADNLSTAMEGAMSGILTMPGAQVETLSFKDSLTGATGDEVTRAKTDLVSDTADATGANPAQDGQDALAARYEKLYTDMTVFQVAWSIARRVQQDTSQLLRGQ